MKPRPSSRRTILHHFAPPEISDRVQELIARYGNGSASAAGLLCDRHDPATLAFRLVKTDLGAEDIRYGELRIESERFAAALQGMGVGSGDRVATLMGKCREYLVAVMAIWRLGAVHVPLFTAFAPAAIAFRLTGSKARVVVCDASQQSKLSPGEDMPVQAPWKVVTTGAVQGEMLNFHDLMAEAQPGIEAAALGGQAPLIHIYTSGTTGRPKGVIVPVMGLASFQAYLEFGLGLQPDDCYWCAADPGWAYGLYYGILGSFLTGVPGILLEGAFSAEATLAVLSRYGVTHFAAAPTVYRALRASNVPVPKDLRLRGASSAGEPLTPEVNEWAVAALGVPVHDHYGQTETGMLINNHHSPQLSRPLKPGSMGHSMPGWKAAILDKDRDELAAVGETGRLAIDLAASPLAWFEGYLDDPAKSAEKFTAGRRWYVTGDSGRRDADDYFFFSSRDDDLIIMAGYRISPFEVESVLLMHPGVFEAAAIATPDPIRGEVIEACVVLRPEYTGTEELGKELQQLVKTKFAAHAYPRRVRYLPKLPKTPSGKIQRFLLRQQFGAGLASDTMEKSPPGGVR